VSVGKRSKRQLDKVRQLVFDRDGNNCLAAGQYGFCGGGLTLQHRVGRGMGGSAQYDTPAHLITFCAIHNELQTASATFATLCQSRGWSIPRWAVERVAITVIPVHYPLAGWHLLFEDGTLELVPAMEANAMLLALYGQDESF
jgi:hypothetical protein